MGSYICLRDTDIIMNAQMDDFSTPGKVNYYGLSPFPSNFIVPMRRPISSMCPIIVLDDNNDVVFVSGAAGGSRITSTVAFVCDIFLRILHHKSRILQRNTDYTINIDLFSGVCSACLAQKIFRRGDACQTYPSSTSAHESYIRERLQSECYS